MSNQISYDMEINNLLNNIQQGDMQQDNMQQGNMQLNNIQQAAMQQVNIQQGNVQQGNMQQGNIPYYPMENKTYYSDMGGGTSILDIKENNSNNNMNNIKYLVNDINSSIKKKNKKKSNKKQIIEEEEDEDIEETNEDINLKKNKKNKKSTDKSNSDYDIFKEGLLLVLVYIFLSQNIIKNIFSLYFKSLNPNAMGIVGQSGVIIYGIILTFVFLILRYYFL